MKHLQLPIAFRLAVALLATLLLGACAAAASAPASQLTVHEQDAGHGFSLHPGDTVKVDLIDRFPVPGSSVVWNADTSDGAVLQRVSTNRETPPGIMNSQAHYTAIFKAISAGTAQIQMVGTAHCEAMNPAYCPGHIGTITIIVA